LFSDPSPESQQMKTKILYVEDEPFLGKVVKETLEFRGFDVMLRTDGSGMTEILLSFSPDICVLDVMLPGTDGFTLGKSIRELYPRLPIIFLTAKSQTEDLIKGFESGGTDYIKKPFSVEELMVRIQNQLRINSPGIVVNSVQDKIKLGSLVFFPGKYELHSSDRVILLSNREAQILDILVAAQNQVVDRKFLLKKVWGDDSFFNSRNLDVYIRKLREHLSVDPQLKIITLKGTGYNFIVPPNK
jgi:DNA-binding response OmpR family regulator